MSIYQDTVGAKEVKIGFVWGLGVKQKFQKFVKSLSLKQGKGGMNPCCKEEIKKVLEKILKSGHGGGNFRRIIIQELAKVKNGKKKKG